MFDLRLGDCLEVMADIPDGSVDLTVTSPPYDNLRTYNGNNALWGDHVWREVIAELYRVTADGGVVVWVVADATIKGGKTGTSFKQALYAIECGFRLHDTMIYQKLNYLPQNAKSRYDQCFEYIFVFAKGAPKTANLLRDRKNAKAGQTLMTGGRKNKDGKLHDKRVVRCQEFGLRSNVWPVAVGGKAVDHPAPMPERLCNDLLVSWSDPGHLVLDPFMGSGTTGKMAAQLGRRFIGIELDPEYFAIAEARINGANSRSERSDHAGQGRGQPCADRADASISASDQRPANHDAGYVGSHA